MPKPTILAVVIPLAIAASSCSRPTRVASGNDVDLQRDLQLASTSTLKLANSTVDPAKFGRLETQPQSAPQVASHLRKGAGPKAITSRTPDLKATLIPQVAALNISQIQTEAPAPALTPTMDPVATLPAPGSAPGLPGTDGVGDANGQGDGNSSGGYGPRIGVVIRGGGVDGDHCEPHGRGPLVPGIYAPPIGGFGGTTRFPTFPRGGIH